MRDYEFDAMNSQQEKLVCVRSGKVLEHEYDPFK